MSGKIQSPEIAVHYRHVALDAHYGARTARDIAVGDPRPFWDIDAVERREG
ncbi:uncharacterized protein FOMMEDRAFT_150470 [Fomitiporia mediterranea MF3/22]|uniref:uncharacterized protein n=1 Tax=Fomitiporia mediterranea (strain MF3/22) TaxID=694068 RepID=UPI00044089EF|nr:uncharacterized protein FOMMEDRAFT_150470 [Fomitiporia mediterranea MF3/22]EJD07882.1 hypothetical protein FOMMEDRAFT_150470 [Fomitiporia mediterranea MF3/22]